MKPVFQTAIIVLFALASHGKNSQFSRFKAEMTPKFMMVPDKTEKAILENYLTYLDGGDAKSIEKIVSDLKQKALRNWKPVSPQWISLFEGNSEFCLRKNPNVCEYSIGSASNERLRPKVDAGDKLAVELAACILDGGLYGWRRC